MLASCGALWRGRGSFAWCWARGPPPPKPCASLFPAPGLAEAQLELLCVGASGPQLVLLASLRLGFQVGMGITQI